VEAWQERLKDAHRFWDAAEMLADDPEYGKQAVSNAVLAVIAANDAVCLCLAGRRPSGQSHTEAAGVLERVCRGTRHEKEASVRADQLVAVLSQKNAAQYLAGPMSPETVRRVLRQGQRFLQWATAVVESA
jgi:hypothetical protein